LCVCEMLAERCRACTLFRFSCYNLIHPFSYWLVSWTVCVYLCPSVIMAKKVGCGTHCFICVLCSLQHFIFVPYFCAWFVMCWFWFFLFLSHSHLHSPVHCNPSPTVFNNQSCTIAIGWITGRPWATKVRRCNWVPARPCWGNCKSCFHLFILRREVLPNGSESLLIMLVADCFVT
jgi:hypothetical protein